MWNDAVKNGFSFVACLSLKYKVLKIMRSIVSCEIICLLSVSHPDATKVNSYKLHNILYNMKYVKYVEHNLKMIIRFLILIEFIWLNKTIEIPKKFTLGPF